MLTEKQENAGAPCVENDQLLGILSDAGMLNGLER